MRQEVNQMFRDMKDGVYIRDVAFLVYDRIIDGDVSETDTLIRLSSSWLIPPKGTLMTYEDADDQVSLEVTSVECIEFPNENKMPVAWLINLRDVKDAKVPAYDKLLKHKFFHCFVDPHTIAVGFLKETIEDMSKPSEATK